MEYDYKIFKGLFDIWKKKNYDPKFYFDEIYNKSLSVVSKRAHDHGIELDQGGRPKYPALFIPVGFSMENVVIMAGLFKPDYLTLAFSEISKHFHRMHLTQIKECIRKVNLNVKIREMIIQSEDQKLMEEKIVEWVEEISAGEGLSQRQMAIDLTGGTKPMSIGAYNASFSFDDIDAFYLRVDYDEETLYPIPGTETLVRLDKGKPQVEKDLVFVIMPFSDQFTEVYEKGIKFATESMSKRCVRVDEEIFTGGIMNRIRENLLKANIVVVELTQKNPNVYYELGIAHAYGKQVIMLAQDINNIPFDLRHLRIVIYSKDDPSKLAVTLAKEMQYLK